MHHTKFKQCTLVVDRDSLECIHKQGYQGQITKKSGGESERVIVGCAQTYTQANELTLNRVQKVKVKV